MTATCRQICDLGLSAKGKWYTEDEHLEGGSQSQLLSQESVGSTTEFLRHESLGAPETLQVKRTGAGVEHFPGYGTATFRAPELKLRQGDAPAVHAEPVPISEKCDLWAFGAVTVYAFLNELPEGWVDGDADKCLSSFRRVCRGEHDAPTLVPGLGAEDEQHEQLCALIESCLHHTPTERPCASEAITTLVASFKAVMGGRAYFRPTPDHNLKLPNSENKRREMVIARDVKCESDWQRLEIEYKRARADEARKKERKDAQRVSALRAAGRASSTRLWSDKDAEAGEPSPHEFDRSQPAPVAMDVAVPAADTAEAMAAELGPYLGNGMKRTSSSGAIRPTGQSVAKFSRVR